MMSKSRFKKFLEFTKSGYYKFLERTGQTEKFDHKDLLKETIKNENKRKECWGCKHLGTDGFSSFHWSCEIGYKIPNPDCEIFRGEEWRKQHGKELCESN